MKKVKIKEKKEIDWSKPQWVQGKSTEDTIILTNGKHSDISFTGMALPSKNFPEGCYYTAWSKENFQSLSEDVPFIISNKED